MAGLFHVLIGAAGVYIEAVSDDEWTRRVSDAPSEVADVVVAATVTREPADLWLHGLLVGVMLGRESVEAEAVQGALTWEAVVALVLGVNPGDALRTIVRTITDVVSKAREDA